MRKDKDDYKDNQTCIGSDDGAVDEGLVEPLELVVDDLLAGRESVEGHLRE